jgi:hypothetical protein
LRRRAYMLHNRVGVVRWWLVAVARVQSRSFPSSCDPVRDLPTPVPQAPRSRLFAYRPRSLDRLPPRSCSILFPQGRYRSIYTISHKKIAKANQPATRRPTFSSSSPMGGALLTLKSRHIRTSIFHSSRTEQILRTTAWWWVKVRVRAGHPTV